MKSGQSPTLLALAPLTPTNSMKLLSRRLQHRRGGVGHRLERRLDPSRHVAGTIGALPQVNVASPALPTDAHVQQQQQGQGSESVGVVIVDHGSRKRDSNDMLVRSACPLWAVFLLFLGQKPAVARSCGKVMQHSALLTGCKSPALLPLHTLSLPWFYVCPGRVCTAVQADHRHSECAASAHGDIRALDRTSHR